jgi:uncharacterized SAM-binding protein YcdF (DUF218 family)
MRILIETSGGGGLVLLIVVALAMSHSGGIGAMVAAVLVAILIAIVATVLSVGGYLMYRVRQRAPASLSAPPVTLHAEVLPAGPRQALAPPQVRLDPDQLAELAEILRREQRPE